ncbi:hypothetical protein L9F63_004077, partial [Diploptera punctata]
LNVVMELVSTLFHKIRSNCNMIYDVYSEFKRKNPFPSTPTFILNTGASLVALHVSDVDNSMPGRPISR